jgi:glyoxylase-like metal-dependent hydrolase (beta-lactamase superfamily II)/rhodanese-related sulfurtransferase
MFFRQVLHDDLGCASYVIADGGMAAVIDPKWEVEDYLALATAHGLRIAHILETHNHADHLSGHGRLAAATGARIHVSRDAGVAYEHEGLADGDTIELGQARIRALATPGHRPEHLAFAVEDASRGEEPWLLLTGDSLFVGDVARPDLAVEPEDGARVLHGSLLKLVELPDYVEVWPGHIGGSLCGGSGMSETPGSTLGFERRFNRFLRIDKEDEFVRTLTGELAPQPPNFARIVALNRGPLLTEASRVEPLALGRVGELLDQGATLLDGRSPREYDGAHLAGSINVTMAAAAVGTRAAWVVDPDSEVVVLAASDAGARRLAVLLEAVGFRSIRGFLQGGIAAWQEAGGPIATTVAIDAPTLAARLRRDDVVLLDVRERHEWEEGHVEDSIHVPYHELRERIPDEIRSAAAEHPLAVACSAGNRSSIAASLLERAGIDRVEHVAEGGIEGLPELGIELVDGRSGPA